MTPKNSRRSSASRVKLASRQRDQGIEADGEQALDLAPMDGVHDLDGGVAGAGQVVRRDAPDAGDVLARRGVGEAALARQLVALLAVLAAALAVALAGDHDAAGAFPPDVSGGERNGADGFAVLDALGVVLDAAGVQNHGAAGFADPMRRALDGVGRNAADFGCALRVPGLGRFGGLLEAGGVRVDELPIGESVANDDVQHGQEQRQVGAGADRKIQVGVARDGGEARIGHDELRAVVAGAPDVIGSDGGALADIGAEHHDDFGLGDVAPRVRGAVHAERALVGGSGGHHAEPAVVIDMARSERDARELAEQVGLFGGEGGPAVDCYRVRSVLFLQLAQTACGEAEGLLPGSGTKAARRCASGDRAGGRGGCPADSA